MTRSIALAALLAAALHATPAAAQQRFPCSGRLVLDSIRTDAAPAGDARFPAGTRYFFVFLRNTASTNLYFDMGFLGFPADVQAMQPSHYAKYMRPGQRQGFLFAQTTNPNFSPFTIAFVHDDAAGSGRPTVRLQNCQDWG